MQLAVIKREDIYVGDRYRKDYGDITELAESIKQKGLLQPIVVGLSKEGAEQPYFLIAGGRRYKAIETIEMDHVRACIYDKPVSELLLRELEYEENFQRKDLEWPEQVALQKRIHDLQVATYGEKISTSPNAPGWSLKDTTDLLGVSKPSVQKDVQLARAVEAVPEAFEGCKSKSEAAKLLKRIGEQMLQQEMLKRAKATPTAAAKKSLLDCYIVGDFFEEVPKIPDGSMNFIEIDPPYAIDLKKAKLASPDTLEHYNEVPFLEYVPFMEKVLAQAYRTLTEHGWMIVWFAPEPWFDPMYHMICNAGFITNRMCGIWTKPTGQSKRPETNLANAYEMFFICRKGKPVLNRQGRSNVFTFDPVPDQHKIHPTERPLTLMQDILTTFCTPGSRILVPFLGSGTTLIAASSVQMSGLGYELGKEYKDRYILKVHKMEELA